MEDSDVVDGGPARKEELEEEGPGGVFPNWNTLYATVLVYAFLLILIFYALSETLDFSGS